MRASRNLIIALTVALGACNGHGDGPTESAGNGTLKVVAATSGAFPDADGYLVTLADGSGEAIGANAEWSVREFPAGSYTLHLTGVAGNCSVAGENPRTVMVEPGQLATLDFAVSCTASVRIVTETTGVDVDASGILLTIGDDFPARVPASGIKVIRSSADGTLPLKVADLAPNCTPDPGNPSTVSVLQPVTEVSLRFSCVTATGTISVSLSVTSWINACTSVFVTLGEQRRPLIADTPTLFEGVAKGSHVVSISGLSDSCVLLGDSTRTVTVRALATAQVVFMVSSGGP